MIISPAVSEKLWSRFHERIKGFGDFENPGEDFQKRETTYKRALLKKFDEKLGRQKLTELVSSGQGAKAAAEVIKILGSANIVSFQSWNISLSGNDAALCEVLRAYLDATANPYHGTETTTKIFEISSKHGLTVNWDVLGVVLWALRPTDFFPIKISYYRELAEEIGLRLQKGKPDAQKLDQVIEFGRAFREALKPKKPSDWVDVQSFIWSVCPRKETDTLAPPFDDMFSSFKEAQWGFELLKTTLEKLGVSSTEWESDERISLTLLSQRGEKKIRLNFGNWIILTFLNKAVGESRIQYVCANDNIPATSSLAWEGGTGFKNKIEEREYNIAICPVAKMHETESMERKAFDESLTQVEKRFKGWKGSAYRRAHKPQLLQMAFDSELRDELLRTGLDLSSETSFASIINRYSGEQIIFGSSVKKRRYAISAVDETGFKVERLDANEPEKVTFKQAEKLIEQVVAKGSLDFASLDSTSAVRNAILQAEELTLTADQKQIVFLPDNSARLQNFLQILDNLKKSNPFYKPAMLQCVVEGIESGELPDNRITFDWIAPRFLSKMKMHGKEATEHEAARPFYHLTGDLIWLHAVQNRADLMEDGGEGPNAARQKIKYALLKDTYWNLLQDAESRAAVRQQLDTIMPSITHAMKLPTSLNTILYGPPGTGKTHTLRNKYMEMFTDRQVVLTPDERAASLVKDLAWWEVIAIALLDMKDNRGSVAQVLSHQLVEARLKQSANKNPRAMLWASLQSHTMQDCPNVNYTTRIEPLLFLKDEESIWSIDVKRADAEVPELRKKLNDFRNPEKVTTPLACRYKFTTFHQSFSYEDFIEGIKPQLDGGDDGQISYEVRDGIFKEICKEAESNPSKKFALFIDEINRGNVASIFGELITVNGG